MGGDQIDPPRLIIVHQSSWNALNGLIFHDFVPFNIWKVLGKPFLGFLFENFENFFDDDFFHEKSKGYMSKNAFLIVPFLGSKIVPINLLIQNLGAKIIYFCQNMHFYQVWIIFLAFNKGGSIWPPPHVLTYLQKPM